MVKSVLNVLENAPPKEGFPTVVVVSDSGVPVSPGTLGSGGTAGFVVVCVYDGVVQTQIPVIVIGKTLSPVLWGSYLKIDHLSRSDGGGTLLNP
jgi:hypothetical protein